MAERGSQRIGESLDRRGADSRNLSKSCIRIEDLLQYGSNI